MAIILSKVLGPEDVAAVRKASESIEFIDGRATAGRLARQVKNNEQAPAGGQTDALLQQIGKALTAHEVFRSVARPRKFTRMLLSRYKPGMHYGAHVDNAMMGGSRTDMSFTLFLSEQDSYEGGGLVMHHENERRIYRMQAGDAVIYPTSVTHEVAPVTSGERLAVVGWVQSWVRDPAQREVLHDLDVASAAMNAAVGKTPEFDRMQKAKTNLLRMWCDG